MKRLLAAAVAAVVLTSCMTTGESTTTFQRTAQLRNAAGDVTGAMEFPESMVEGQQTAVSTALVLAGFIVLRSGLDLLDKHLERQHELRKMELDEERDD